jgi:hypothetical protein
MTVAAARAASRQSLPTPIALQKGYSICLVFLTLFERVYSPLTAGLLNPIKADAWLQSQRRSQLDHLYQRVVDDLETLMRALGLKAA